MTEPEVIAAAEMAAKLIASVWENGDIAPTDSGHYVYYSTERGYLTSNDLRIIADELDRANKPLDDSITAYFEGSKCERE